MPLFRLRHRIEPEFFAHNVRVDRFRTCYAQNDTTIRARWNLKGGIHRFGRTERRRKCRRGWLFLRCFLGRIERVCSIPWCAICRSRRFGQRDALFRYLLFTIRKRVRVVVGNLVVCVRGNICVRIRNPIVVFIRRSAAERCRRRRSRRLAALPEPPTTCSARSEGRSCLDDLEGNEAAERRLQS